jgi:hypothetical protein
MISDKVKLILMFLSLIIFNSHLNAADLLNNDDVSEELKREISSIGKDGKKLDSSDQQLLIEQLNELKKRKEEESKILEEMMEE